MNKEAEDRVLNHQALRRTRKQGATWVSWPEGSQEGLRTAIFVVSKAPGESTT